MVTPASLNGAYWALAVPAASVDATKSPAIAVLMNASLMLFLASFGGTLRILAYARKLVRSAGAVADAATPPRGVAPLLCARCRRTDATGGQADTGAGALE